jgi:predicted N-formylglutamate amidohydrolase
VPGALSLVISCEHGGRDVPPDYAALFAGQAPLLDSHRGWDPGALVLGQQMAQALRAPLFAATTTRLLIDLNRSIGHRQLYSEVTRGLPRAQREQIVRLHYRPHRDAVEGEVARCIAAGHTVAHIASHSFTPVLHDEVRRADVACLYDPRRPREVALSRHWLQALAQRLPGLQLRCNYPYQGRGDGLTALLRKRFSAEAYVGIELEVNQRWVTQGGAPWLDLCAQVVASLAAALATETTSEG